MSDLYKVFNNTAIIMSFLLSGCSLSGLRKTLYTNCHKVLGAIRFRFGNDRSDFETDLYPEFRNKITQNFLHCATTISPLPPGTYDTEDLDLTARLHAVQKHVGLFHTDVWHCGVKFLQSRPTYVISMFCKYSVNLWLRDFLGRSKTTSLFEKSLGQTYLCLEDLCHNCLRRLLNTIQNWKKPALTRVQRPTPAMLLPLAASPSDSTHRNNRRSVGRGSSSGSVEVTLGEPGVASNSMACATGRCCRETQRGLNTQPAVIFL